MSNVISIEGSLKSDIPPKAVCTCGWEYGPSEELFELGTAAFQHRDNTGHGLRQHTFGMSEDH